MKSNKNTTEFLDKLCKEQRKLNHLLTKDDEFTVKYLICRICKDVLHNPKECGECEENFCDLCLNDYLNKNKICINSCMEKKISKSHPLILSKLEKLSFSCLFCTKHILYSSIPKHLSICENRQEICKNENCKFKGIPEEVCIHAETCEYTNLFCPICKTDFQKIDKHCCGDLFLEKYKNLRVKLVSNSKMFDEKIRELESILDNAIKVAKEKEEKERVK